MKSIEIIQLIVYDQVPAHCRIWPSYVITFGKCMIQMDVVLDRLQPRVAIATAQQRMDIVLLFCDDDEALQYSLRHNFSP